MRRLVLLAGLLYSCALSAHATNLPVNFIFAELPPESTQVPLPFLLNGVDDTMFLKFKIPDISKVSAIDSFEILIAFFDDGDGGGESATVQFAMTGPNITLGTFGPNINRTNPANPLIMDILLTPDQIAQVVPEIADGNFRIKIQRDSGDFFVGGTAAFIDATLGSPSSPTPEPGSFLTMITGLVAAAAGIRLKRARG